jgi:hypothetical protein
MRASIAIAALTLLCGCSGGDPAASAELRRSHLVFAPEDVTDECRALAARARAQGVELTVYCPPVVPDVRPIRLELACGVDVCARLSGGYLMAFWAPIARDARKWGGHWTVGAGRPDTMRHWAPTAALRTKHVRIAGRPVTLDLVSPTRPAFYAGHVVATWRQAGLSFQLTVHGFRWESRLRVMTAALIDEVRRCSGRDAERTAACSRLVFRSR